MTEYRVQKRVDKYRVQWLNERYGFFGNKRKWMTCGFSHQYGHDPVVFTSEEDARAYIKEKKNQELPWQTIG